MCLFVFLRNKMGLSLRLRLSEEDEKRRDSPTFSLTFTTP